MQIEDSQHHDASEHVEPAKPETQMLTFPATAIVLCRAQYGGNVGAVCRAMDAMGFSRLILADCPHYDTAEVKTFALKSYSIYEQAKRYETLEAALAGFSYAAGFTRRSGAKRRELIPVQQWSLARFDLLTGGCALVFGNEQNGLSETELACCDENIYIPTTESQPSLNLAQAIQLVAWECRRLALENDLGLAQPLHHVSDPNAEQQPASFTRQSIDRAYIDKRLTAYCDLLEPYSVFRKGNRGDIEVLLRSILCRSNCSQKEADRFFDFLENTTKQISTKRHQ